MRLGRYDTGLVRRLRRAVKARANRSGFKGFQKRWWSGSQTSRRNIFLFLWLGAIAIRVMAERLGQVKGTEVVTGCVSLAFAGIALQRAKHLRKALTVSFERVQSYFYPVSESEFVGRILVQSGATAWWLLALGLGIFRMLQTGNTTAVWVTSSLAAIADVFVVLTLVFGLEPYLEVVPGWLPLGLFGMAAVWLFMPQNYATGQQMWVNVLPTGWANLLITSSWTADARIAALSVMSAVFGAAMWFFARRRWLELIKEFERSLVAEIAAEEEKPSEACGALEYQKELTGPEEDEGEGEVLQPLPIQAAWQKQEIDVVGKEWSEAVRGGAWLVRVDWSQLPWVERAIGWWLRGDEKDTLQFLTGGRVPDWSNAWRNSVIALAVGVLFAALLPANWRWLGAIAILASLGIGLPVGGGTWAAISPGWISGKLSPLYGVYPLAYSRASRVIAKVNLVRTAAWMPLGAALTIVDARISNQPMGEKFWLAARVLLIWFAWMPIAIAGQFSKGTNDTSMLRARQIVVIPVVIVVLSIVLILWGTILIVDRPEVLIGAVGAIAGSVGIWAAYGWWYNRKVDLLRDRE